MGLLLNSRAMVADVSFRPSAKAFQGSQEWWEYVLSRDERKRLDHLFGMALLDETICRRLLVERDESLLVAFELSERTKQFIRKVNAASLSDLAQAVIDTLKATA